MTTPITTHEHIKTRSYDKVFHTLDELFAPLLEKLQMDFEKAKAHRMVEQVQDDFDTLLDSVGMVYDPANVELIAKIAAETGVTAEIMDGTPAQTSENIGTRFTISGGEVLELDAHLEARYEEMTDADPF